MKLEPPCEPNGYNEEEDDAGVAYTAPPSFLIDAPHDLCGIVQLHGNGLVLLNRAGQQLPLPTQCTQSSAADGHGLREL